MVKKPNKIKILGRDFKVQYCSRIGPDDLFGECDGPNRVIKIKNNISNECLHDTLIHECLHAILYLTGQSELLSDEQEESIVIALENGLAGLVELK